MSSALYGRDAQARAVLALLDGTRAGRGGALVVRGEAGIGKTRRTPASRGPWRWPRAVAA